MRSPQHSDSPNASLRAGWSTGTAAPGLSGLLGRPAGIASGPGALADAGPEALLAQLGAALGIAPGALRLGAGMLPR
ncbi:MAG: hypothetical protein JHD16_18755 [Solirubrobacteraceae bacterium]|nr:hypothetical protein [Solirubrobacteraceae bacterium]